MWALTYVFLALWVSKHTLGNFSKKFPWACLGHVDFILGEFTKRWQRLKTHAARLHSDHIDMSRVCVCRFSHFRMGVAYTTEMEEKIWKINIVWTLSRYSSTTTNTSNRTAQARRRLCKPLPNPQGSPVTELVTIFAVREKCPKTVSPFSWPPLRSKS